MFAVDYLDYVLNPTNIPYILFKFKDTIADIMVPLPDQYRSGLSKHILEAINHSDFKMSQLCNKLKDVIASFIYIKKMLITNTIDSSIKQTLLFLKKSTVTNNNLELTKYKYLEIIVGIAVQHAIELDWLSSLI